EGKESREKRLAKAREEIEHARSYDYLILNDDLEKAKNQLQAIILSEHCRRERMMDVLESLLNGGEDFASEKI
ncbi:MAG TPA: hypothetical protein VLS90_08810, partial [Thermodesulfobacteriota bacterium]|nr:hypothetical protein [Thermodesulfobacteriota bacterium]